MTAGRRHGDGQTAPSRSEVKADMTQHHATAPEEAPTVMAHVPLSERPLIAEDERTVITVPEHARSEVRSESTAVGDSYRQRLFPSAGSPGGEESGIRLAHFEITSRLGSGGMGAVFRATDLELARDVALKILHPSSMQDASLIARFRNEARACAQLNHDNIARVFYAGSQDGLYFIAYEYASGSTIRDLIIDRGRLSLADTVNYAIQVTLALNHIAAAGIVHRDIKPSNIMLTESGRVKVVDLGLARRDTTDSIGEITVAGTTLGTFDYISPEQARDPRNADVRSDIYSLGCTMYHMLTGQPPYPEGTALQKLLDHQGKSPPDPALLNPEIPPEMSAIIRKMMSNNPNHRYGVPGLLLNDLIQLASMLGLRSIPAEGIVWRKMGGFGSQQPVGAVWVFASVLLICLTALFLHYSPRRTSVDDQLAYESDADWREVLDPAVYGAAALGEGAKEASAGAGVNVESSVGSGVQKSSVNVTSVNSTTSPSAGAADIGRELQPLSLLPGQGVLNPAVFDLMVLRMNQAPPGVVPPAISEQRADPFVLQSSDGSSRAFQTLKAAVADARSGDVILLRYHGFPDDLPAQPPVRIVGMNLIIRAADGFRPTLEFDGTSEGSVTPGQMFNLRSQGSLTVRDVDLRLIVSDNLTVDRWSLFHCEGANRIRLENVSIDCRNPDGQSAAIFDMTEESTGPVDIGPRNESEFTLNRVICRADADAFRVACQPRGRIHLRNCGFALNGTLLQLRGDSSMQPAQGALEVFLDHVTCLHSAPMMQMNDGDQRKGGTRRTLPRVSIRSEASVFAAIGADPRLLYSQGNSYLEDIESLVTWNGFTNLYDGHSVFWEIVTSALDYSTRRMDYGQWNQFWLNRGDSEETNSLVSKLSWQNGSWKGDGLRIPLQSLTPSSFELDAVQFTVGPTSLPKRDGLIPGVNAQDLPPFPRTRPVAAILPTPSEAEAAVASDKITPTSESNSAQ